MEWIPNQPVYFGEPQTCSDDENIPQLVDNTDTTQVQFSLDACEFAEQLLPDPHFSDEDNYTFGSDWSISDNLLCFEDSSGSGASTVYSLVGGNYYKVVITVASITPGTIIDIKLGANLIGSISSAGVFTFYGQCVAFFGTFINIIPQTDGAACISELFAYDVLTNAIIAIYDTDNNYLNQLNPTDNPTSFTFIKNSMTVTINWGELGISNTCVYLCFLNPCTNTNGQNYPATVLNGDFTEGVDGNDHWILGEKWENEPPMTGVYIPTPNELVQENVFGNLFNSYCISVEVANITGADAVLNVYFGDTLAGTIKTNGVHQITGIPSGDLNLTFTLGAGTTSVEILSVSACDIQPEDYVCDATSNIFKIGDYSDSCTLLINACNNEDGMGFVFDGSGFTPRLRLEAKLRQAKYPSERSIFEDSIGEKSSYYFSGRKAKSLCIDLQMEYIHDFLRLLLGFDNFYIDSRLYFVEDDEYNVEYLEVHDTIGKSRILVSEKTQNVKNINCTDSRNVCTLPPNYLLQADDLSQFITLTTMEKILING